MCIGHHGRNVVIYTDFWRSPLLSFLSGQVFQISAVWAVLESNSMFSAWLTTALYLKPISLHHILEQGLTKIFMGVVAIVYWPMFTTCSQGKSQSKGGVQLLCIPSLNNFTCPWEYTKQQTTDFFKISYTPFIVSLSFFLNSEMV